MLCCWCQWLMSRNRSHHRSNQGWDHIQYPSAISCRRSKYWGLGFRSMLFLCWQLVKIIRWYVSFNPLVSTCEFRYLLSQYFISAIALEFVVDKRSCSGSRHYYIHLHQWTLDLLAAGTLRGKVSTLETIARLHFLHSKDPGWLRAKSPFFSLIHLFSNRLSIRKSDRPCILCSTLCRRHHVLDANVRWEIQRMQWNALPCVPLDKRYTRKNKRVPRNSKQRRSCRSPGSSNSLSRCSWFWKTFIEHGLPRKRL